MSAPVRPEHGWAALATYVIVYDLVALRRHRPTLSACWHKWLEHRIGRPALMLLWAAVTMDLCQPLWKPRWLLGQAWLTSELTAAATQLRRRQPGDESYTGEQLSFSS